MLINRRPVTPKGQVQNSLSRSGVFRTLDLGRRKKPYRELREEGAKLSPTREYERTPEVSRLGKLLSILHQEFLSSGRTLYALTCIGSKWYWDEQCERAFDDLRHRLVREPITLTYPRWDREFHIEADACGSGIGAILGQMDERTGKVRPI